MPKIFRFQSLLAFLFFLIYLMLGSTQSIAEPKQVPQSEIQGYVDSFVADGDKIVAQGWVAAQNSGNKIVSLSVWLGNTMIYEGDFKQFERPDVVKSMGRSDWLKSGWRINTKLPSNLKVGEYSVKVLAKLDNGIEKGLVLNHQVNQVVVNGGLHHSRLVVEGTRYILIVMLTLLGIGYLQADRLAGLLSSKTNKLIKPPVLFGFTLLLCFGVLICLGITGSSFKVGLEHTPFVHSDVKNVWGEDRPIRSDEWVVATPWAIAQYNHRPQFPVVNANIGEDGQNMLVFQLPGVPVAHISSIAKPATWGFFIFDLKRALSWYWCFPIFACLFALWGVVGLLLPGNWKSSFLIALWFSVSPYVAVWSNWPAYAVFFPSLAFISAIGILRSKSKYHQLALGCVLGLAMAGFVLILYPPWQIPLAYLFIALSIAIVVRDKLYNNFNKFSLLSYGFAILLASFLLWEWWLDACLAVKTLLSTIYPGQRSMVLGGSVSLSDLLRGFTNIVTLYKIEGDYSNQCEIASFAYMLLPLILLLVIRGFQNAIGAIEIALAISIAIILYFSFIGLPAEAAQFSLWGRVPPQRADIALGLSYIILSGMLLSSSLKTIQDTVPIKILVFGVAMLWSIIVLRSVAHLPEGVLSGFSPGVLAGLFIVIAVAGYWLAMGKFKEFIYLNLALSVATIGPFNPIRIAPHSVAAVIPIHSFKEKKASHDSSQRILVLETQIPAMYLLASGLSVVNGVFNYPQNSLWGRLDVNRTESDKYNRYQHLVFSGGVVGNIDKYRIESPSAVVVQVMIDLELFDFRKTGAGFLVAPERDERALRNNPALTYIKNQKGWSWFQVLGA
ncbi:hypothetical protein MGMO_94c00130 [Methyloglobulus morosus KoM1]|uniref:Glycosyltransferase RgtA/B/C/D-like domain-containing protein n=1 Tax=Methyloglobulus morosus KoM1 TaxID=1116472 RepID=V5C4B6_9GAMM|nr:hypothetical protein [Methyloglobulus morosus]ESS71598.1 hypothetical protein MGMO_94c00130 [Methyloglobulus morosus KoM1]